ncbi:MAG TPA: tetratricopeptide repeat protein [Bacteroidia bacterium]|jgi:serine phosphatase RsbU (regulator of sigma subunit)|nr:tetratricopeptide repeat protein [Bacteroidia bacterium]
MKQFRRLLWIISALAFFSCHNDGEKNASAVDSTAHSQIRYPLTKDLDTLHQYLKIVGHDTDHVNVLNKMAWQYARRNPDTTRVIEYEALALARELHFATGAARALHNIGYAYSLTGDYDSAVYYVRKSRVLFDSTGFVNGQISASNTLGGIYNEKGDYDSALYWYLDLLKTAENAGNAEAEMSAYSNIGLLYSYKQDYKSSLAYLRKGLAQSREKGNKGVETTTMVNFGKVFGDMGLYDSTLYYNQLAYRNKKESHDLNGMATILVNNAMAYEEKKDFDLAVIYSDSALQLEQQIDDKRGEAITLISIASLNRSMKKNDVALAYLKRARIMLDSTDAKDVERSLYDTYAAVYADQGDYHNAYLAHLEFSRLNDSVLGEQSNRDMTEMEAKYESEKKDKAIVLLQKDQQIQQAEIDRKNSEARRKSLQLYASIAVLALVLCFAVFIFFSLKRNVRLNRILAQKNSLIEEKNKNITDSINYAKRIQGAMLTSDNFLKANLPDHFILNRPKDIVSGDFYWSMKSADGKLFFATADCTGHGVPGAFMSLISVSLLNEIVTDKKLSEPAAILDQLRSEIIHSLNPDGENNSIDGSMNESGVMDGMDAVLCAYDLQKMKLEFAAANNPLWLWRDGEIKIFSPDKMPVGKHEGEQKPFRNQSIELKKGDIIYTFSDGFADQFGGPQGKKFKYSQLQSLLLSVAALPMKEQREKLNAEFSNWKGHLEQIDDVLVVGVRI